MVDVIAEIAAERRRQVEQEGWTADHDDTHVDGSLAFAAVCYGYIAASQGAGRTLYQNGYPSPLWPASWAAQWWKPTTRRRDLVKAAALIVAEIERLDRAEGLAAADMRELQHATAIDAFLEAVSNEVRKAIARFPQPNPVIAALAEEVGEAARAALHIREGKSADWGQVFAEAVQVAAMACRLALEGDPTVGAIPTENNCRG